MSSTLLAFAIALLAAGCTGAADSPSDAGLPPGSVGSASVSLIDHQAWNLLDAEDDSFWDADVGFVPCTTADFSVEGSSAPYLEVSTDACSYITLQQTSLHGAQPGDTLSITLSHEALIGVGAVAHAAVQIGDVTLWSQEIPLVADAQSHNTSMVIDEGFPSGTPILLHIDNHGANSWRLLDIAKTRAVPKK